MSKPVNTIALIAKRESVGVVSLARELADAISGMGVKLLVEPLCAEQIGRPAADLDAIRASDLCVVVGGDGTLIRAAHFLGRAEVPIFGINAGRLGFLTEVSREKAIPLLRQVISGDYVVERRIKLHAQLFRGPQLLLEEDVLNDSVLNRGALAKMVELRASIDGAPVSRFRADGLIVATPTGSTAYNLSANGPILMPTADAIVMTPICPHTLTQRPLVVSDGVKLRIEVTAAEGELLLSLDGRTSAVLQTGDRLELQRAPSRALLVRNPEVDFFAILREKLRWGQS